jgi:hypothetical protein
VTSDYPLGDAQGPEVATYFDAWRLVSSARLLELPFEVHEPRSLGALTGPFLYAPPDPDSTADSIVGWKIELSAGGSAVLEEAVIDESAAKAEIIEESSHVPGCVYRDDGAIECHTGERSLVDVGAGSPGLLLKADSETRMIFVVPLQVRDPDGMAPFIERGHPDPALQVTLFGPPKDLDSDQATSLARSLVEELQDT